MSSSGREPVVRIEMGWDPPARSELVSIQELASMAGISLRTLRRRQAAGEMPQRIQRSRSLMYRRANALEWLARVNAAQSGELDRPA